MKSKSIKILVVLLMFSLAVVYWYASKPKHDINFAEVAELSAKDITVMDLKGNKVSLSQFKGKPILLNFWATWCPPCVEEFPDLIAFSKWAAENLGLIVLAVSIDQKVSDIQKFLDKNKFTRENTNSFQVLSNTDGAAAIQYGTSQFPESFFIDKSFQVARKFVGIQKWNSEEIKKWFMQQK